MPREANKIDAGEHAQQVPFGTDGLGPIDRGAGQRRTSDQVFRELTRAIRTLRLEPGQLLSETELARQLGVSRTPVRDALARLVDMGLVAVTPQVGTRVSLIQLGEVEQARFMREHLEVAAFEAAAKLPDIDTTQARAFLTEQRAAAKAGDLDRFFAADEAMHEQIFAMCGYRRVWEAVGRMKIQLDRIRRLSLPEPAALEGLMAEHEQILDALDKRDVAAGRRQIRAHARRAIEIAPKLREKHRAYFSE